VILRTCAIVSKELENPKMSFYRPANNLYPTFVVYCAKHPLKMSKCVLALGYFHEIL